MDKNTYEAQVAANFVAGEIRRTGQNAFERMKKLKAVFNSDAFTMAELTVLMDPDWKSPEQIEAEKEAAESAAAAKPNRKAA